MTLEQRFLAALQRAAPDPAPVLLAVSGGLDSMVLLELVARTRDRHGHTVAVTHVDHGIHLASAAPAALVARRAESLGLPCTSTQLRLGPACSETAARRARYQWLRAERVRLGARWIVTAHQADDQRETVLMRALRGSGPSGLAGIAAARGDLLRPLLRFSRRTLLGYANALQLEWWDDPANRDPRHLRSWLRQAALPYLRDRFPDLDRKLEETRRHAVRGRLAWDAALARWPGLDPRVEGGVASLDRGTAGALPPGLTLALVSALVRRVGGPAAPHRVRQALGLIARGGSGVRAPLGAGWWLERSFDRLVVLPPAGEVVPPVPLSAPAGQTDWGRWRVRWEPDTAPATQARDGTTAWFIPGTLAVRSWRAGDRLAPLGGSGHRLAVRCFQDARVPSGARARWPIIEGEGKLAWIPGVCRSRDLLPAAGAPAMRIEVGSVD